jgi:hypothetical protein
MPLGTQPISSAAVCEVFTPPAGAVGANAIGVQAKVQLGATVGSALVRHFTARGVAAEAVLGAQFDLFIEGKHRTLFTVGLSATGLVGSTPSSARAGSAVGSVTAPGQLGLVIAQGTFVPAEGVFTAMEPGVTGQIERQAWARIVPEGDAGMWTPIVPVQKQNLTRG